MPKITIFERDNTGGSPVEDLAVVFVPGKAAAKNVDDNNCVYIPSTASDLSEYFEDAEISYGSDYLDISDVHMVAELVAQGYGVIYQQIKTGTEYVLQSPINAELYYTTNYRFAAQGQTYKTQEDYVAAVNAATANQQIIATRRVTDIGYTYDKAAEWAEGTTYYTGTCIGVLYTKSKNTYTPASGDFSDSAEYYTVIPALSTKEEDWAFLNDKNAYDIKFLTTGTFSTVPVAVGASTTQGTTSYTFDFSLLNALLTVPTSRKDCAVLVDLGYENLLPVSGRILVADFKRALNTAATSDKSATLTRITGGTQSECVSSRAYTSVANCLMSYDGAIVRVPNSFVYLYAYAKENNKAATWLPISGVVRGLVGEVFTPDIEFSKYQLDKDIINDREGISFNGIVDVRSYGYTIWGDRTLLDQDAVRGVQATSYFSIRNLISDIAKTAYRSAIRYTYETNNDVTWLNFKQRIVTLLDQVVASGVLQTYKISKVTTVESDNRNSIGAKIVLYCNLPVENWEILINLENAEVTTTADEANT